MRIAVLSSLLLATFAHAGRAPTGAPCEKSNECVSKSCGGSHVCRPDSAHPGGLGALCEGDSHCVSERCLGRFCGPPKETRASPSPGGQRGNRTQDERSPPTRAAPVEEPLPEPTPCSEDLMATVYQEKAGVDAYLRYADRDCANFTPEVIAKGKELFSAGYGRNFGVTLTTVKDATAEQLACAKKQYDKDRNPTSRMDFEVPSLCKLSKDLISCTDDLTAAVFKGDSSRAKMACKEHAPEVIAGARAMFVEGYGDFGALADLIEKVTPEQLSCIKRDYEFITAGRTKYGGISLSGLCKRKPEAIACYFELMSIETKERQYDDFNRSHLEGECGSLTTDDIALTKAMRALGYTQSARSIASTLGGSKPERRACLKKLKPAQVSEAEKTDPNFRTPKACAK